MLYEYNTWCYFRIETERETVSGDKRWQRMLDISAFSRILKHRRRSACWEGDKQHSRSSVSLSSCLFSKLKREGSRRERREEFVGWRSEEQKASVRMERKGGEEHKPRVRKQGRHTRKWASGGFLRVTGCCHDCTVLWVNCQNIDWSTWQPSPSSFFPKFYSCSLLLLLRKRNFQLPGRDKNNNDAGVMAELLLIILTFSTKSCLY